MPALLPSSQNDPIIRLFDYYYTSCDVMFKEYDKLWKMLETKGKLSDTKLIQLQRFLQVWLALLYVVGDGFRNGRIEKAYEKLNKDDRLMRIHWDSIQYKLTQLGEDLKSYRNVTFHFQESMDRLDAKRLGFLMHLGRHDPILWARELHEEMRQFFSCYRVEASVRMLSERDD